MAPSGTVKCLAAKARLQRACYFQIMTPHQLFNWEIENMKGPFTMHEYRGEVIILKLRRVTFSCLATLEFENILDRMLILLRGKEKAVELYTLLNKTEVAIDDIKGLITAVYKDEWWLGGVYYSSYSSQVMSPHALASTVNCTCV